MKILAWIAVLGLVFLFAGLSMALSLFSHHLSFVMEGVTPSVQKILLLRILCGIFLTISGASFLFAWIGYRKIKPSTN